MACRWSPERSFGSGPLTGHLGCQGGGVLLSGSAMMPKEVGEVLRVPLQDVQDVQVLVQVN